MNEKKRNHVVEEAEMEPADIPAPVAKNYTLRGAQQAIERREAAVAKREQKILKLQAENNADRKLIKQLNDEGITVLVVEQNANKALKIADRGYVLETGNIIISDTAENMRKDDTVQKAYLGG